MNYNSSPTAPLNYLNHKTGLWSWLTSTDHKRIGLLYLYSITTFFCVAAVLGLLMKIEKIAPGQTIMTAQTYNGMFTIHGIIMIFIVVIPGLAAVYVMILPAMGVVTEIFPTFSQKPVFGYVPIVISSLAIALVGYFVWGHHMFTSGMSFQARWFFSFLTLLVAIPSAIKVFNWLSTMYGGSIDLKPPLLYAISFIFLFTIGGFTGLLLGSLATNIQTHNTDFVVAHFIISFSEGWDSAFLPGFIIGIRRYMGGCTA